MHSTCRHPFQICPDMRPDGRPQDLAAGSLASAGGIPTHGRPLLSSFAAASEYAKEALTRDLSVELAPQGIRVASLGTNAIVETDTFREVLDILKANQLESRKRVLPMKNGKPSRSPVVLMRISSILLFLTMLGHAAAYPWTSTTQNPRELKLVESMINTPYVFYSNTPYAWFGERTTYWGLYFGWGILVPVLLLALAVTLWTLSGLAHLDPRSIGTICAALAATSLVGAFISIRFFFTPPVLTYSTICILLMTAAVQLLRQQTMFEDERTEKL